LVTILWVATPIVIVAMGLPAYAQRYRRKTCEYFIFIMKSIFDSLFHVPFFEFLGSCSKRSQLVDGYTSGRECKGHEWFAKHFVKV